MSIIVCMGPNCQTAAGCQCNKPSTRPSLSFFTDDEIAREYHYRAMRKLGDQRVGVTMPVRDWTP